MSNKPKIQLLSIGNLESASQDIDFTQAFDDLHLVEVNKVYKISEEQKEAIKSALGLNRQGRMSYVDRKMNLGCTVRKYPDGNYGLSFWIPNQVEIAS